MVGWVKRVMVIKKGPFWDDKTKYQVLKLTLVCTSSSQLLRYIKVRIILESSNTEYEGL